MLTTGVTIGKHLSRYLGLTFALGLLIVVFSISSEHFLQVPTFVAIANRLPELTLISVGMTLVMVIGGIDLSVGSLMAFSGAIAAVLIVHHSWPPPLAFFVAILGTGLIGGISGAITVGLKIPPFIVTLGVLWIVRGLTKVITDSQIIFVGQRIEFFGQPTQWSGLAPTFYFALFIVFLSQGVLFRTVFGRYCRAIGSNVRAVALSGIRVGPVCLVVYLLSGVLAGLAGLASASRLSSCDPNGAIGIELSAIAACVLGGTSLKGGRGSILATFLGVVFMEVLQTGLAQLGIADANKQVITGSVIVVAVVIDAFRGSNRET